MSLQKAKVTPFVKVPPEMKKIEKPLGVIGQKSGNGGGGGGTSGGGGGGGSGIGGLHGASSPVTSAAVPPLSSNSLFTIPDNNYSHRLKEEAYSRSLYSGFGDSAALAGPQNNNSSHSWDPKTLTVPAMRPPPGLVQAHDFARHHGPLTGKARLRCISISPSVCPSNPSPILPHLPRKGTSQFFYFIFSIIFLYLM